MIISGRNMVDLGTVTCDAESAALPATNVQDQRGALVSRSTGLQAPVGVRWSLSGAQVVEAVLVACFHHNWTANATARSQARNGAVNAGVSRVLEVFANESDIVWPSAAIVIIDNPVPAIDYDLTVTDATNPAGFIDVGRWHVGNVHRPARDIVWEATLAHVDSSEITEGDQSNEWYKRRPPRRTFEASYRCMTKLDAIRYAYELDALLGMTRDAVVILDEDETDERRAFTMRCRFSALTGVTRNEATDSWGRTFQLIEVI